MSRGRKALIAAAALGGLALVWTIVWFCIAWQLGVRIDGWLAARRAEGWSAIHGPVAVSGFPHAWRIRIETPRLVQRSTEGTGFAWAGPWIELRWAPWTPSTIGMRSRGLHQLGWGGPPFTVSAADLRGFLRFGPRGGIAVAGFGSDGLTITSPEGDIFRVNRATVRATAEPLVTTPPAGPPPAGAAEIEILGLTLPERSAPPLGRTVGRFALDAVLMGAIPRGTATAALTAWRDEGGTVEVAKLGLGWGALSVEGSGTLALDIGLQPIGALTARIAGFSETTDRLAATGVLTPPQALMTKLMLNGLARPPEGGGRPEITVPVSAQNGMLHVGPLALLRLPKVVWQ